MNPKIEIKIDMEAIRFSTEHEHVNLFWSDLFAGGGRPGFQAQVMAQLHRLYEECIKHTVMPDYVIGNECDVCGLGLDACVCSLEDDMSTEMLSRTHRDLGTYDTA